MTADQKTHPLSVTPIATKSENTKATGTIISKASFTVFSQCLVKSLNKRRISGQFLQGAFGFCFRPGPTGCSPYW